MKLRGMAVGTCIFGIVLTVSAKDQRWEDLREAPHHTTYGFRVRGQRECTFGHLRKMKGEHIEVKLDGGEFIRIPRNLLLRIEDDHEATDIMYSAVSSWADVKTLLNVSPLNPEYVRITLKNGQRHEGKITKVTDSEVTLKPKDKQALVIAKSELATVDYIRVKPVSDGAGYELRERVYVRPELWSYGLGHPPKMTVRVYDASLPEEPNPPKCEWPY